MATAAAASWKFQKRRMDWGVDGFPIKSNMEWIWTLKSPPLDFVFSGKKSSKNHTNLHDLGVQNIRLRVYSGTLQKISKNHTFGGVLFLVRFLFPKTSPAFGSVHLPLRGKTPPFRLSDLCTIMSDTALEWKKKRKNEESLRFFSYCQLSNTSIHNGGVPTNPNHGEQNQ